MTEIDDVLKFWFAPGRGKAWFEKDAAFDQAVRDALGPAFGRAGSGSLDGWRETALGCLALCLLLDQVPRNIFRGDPRAFATDGQARALARHAIEQGFDRTLRQVERRFLYLPLEHSEDLADQEDGCALMAELDEQPDWHLYAVRHRDIVARFGRFPHRNEVLGRVSSEAELTFLREPNSSF